MTPVPANPDDNKIFDTVHTTYVIRAIWTDTTFALPINSVMPSDNMYFNLQFISQEDNLSSSQLNLSAPTSWTRTTKAAITSGTTSNPSTEPCIVVKPADLADAHSFIFVWLKDELGNISVYNLPNPADDGQNWWTADSTPPSGSPEVKMKKGNNEVTENVGYKKSVSGNTVTISYNHALGKIDTLALDTTNVIDKCNNAILGGVGLAGLYYTVDTDTTLNSATNNAISLDGNYSTYKIYAKDKLGNTTTAPLQTIVLEKDDTVAASISFTPKNGESNAASDAYSLVNTDNAYTLKFVKTESSVGVTQVTITVTDSASDLQSTSISTTGNFTGSCTIQVNNINVGSSNDYTITATDKAGNTLSWTLTVTPVSAAGELDPNPNIRFTGAPGFMGDLSASQISTIHLPGLSFNKDLDTNAASTSNEISRSARKAAKKAAKKAKVTIKAKAKTADAAPLVEEIASQVEELASQVEELTPETVDIISEQAAAIESLDQPLVLTNVEALVDTAITQPAKATTPKAALWILLCVFIASACAVVIMLKKRVEK